MADKTVQKTRNAKSDLNRADRDEADFLPLADQPCACDGHIVSGCSTFVSPDERVGARRRARVRAH
jgi:hypothetical protein